MLYSTEFGWNLAFEGLVAEVIAHFTSHFDETRERCWIAERDGENIGSVFLVKKSATVAKCACCWWNRARADWALARHSSGRASTSRACVAIDASPCGPTTICTPLGHIYRTEGFVRVAKEPHDLFGVPSIGETWELAL